MLIIFSKNFIVTLFWNRKAYIVCFLHSYAMKISVFIHIKLYILCNHICNKLVAQYKHQTIQSDQCPVFDVNLWFNIKSIFERFQRTFNVQIICGAYTTEMHGLDIRWNVRSSYASTLLGKQLQWVKVWWRPLTVMFTKLWPIRTLNNDSTSIFPIAKISECDPATVCDT